MANSKKTTRLYTALSEDIPNFFYREPMENKNKSRTAYINRSSTDDSRPEYQFVKSDETRLKCPFGISEPFGKENEPKKEDVDRKSLDMTIESPELMKVLTQLDERNKDVAFQNRNKWFVSKQPGKELSRDLVEMMYTACVRMGDPTKNCKPTFRTKVNLRKGSDRATRFFLALETPQGGFRYQEMDHTVLTKGSRVVPIVAVAGLWFSNTGFGCTLECTDVIVYPNASRESFPFQLEGPQNSVSSPCNPNSNCENNSCNADAPTDEQMNDYVPPSSPHNI